MKPWWVVLWGVLWRIPAMFVLAAIVAVRRAWGAAGGARGCRGAVGDGGAAVRDVEHEFFAVVGRVLAARLALRATPGDPAASRDMTEAYMFLCGMTLVMLERGCPPGLDRATVEAVQAWAEEAARESEISPVLS